MKFEVHQLAARLGLQKELKTNPKVAALLEQFLEDEKKMLPEPPQPPRKPGAVRGWTYSAYIASQKKDQ